MHFYVTERIISSFCFSGGNLKEWLTVFQIGGFQLPFIVIAVTMVVGATFNYFVMEQNEKGNEPGNFFSLLKWEKSNDMQRL